MGSETPSLVEIAVLLALCLTVIGFVFWRYSVKEGEMGRVSYEVRWRSREGTWGVYRAGKLLEDDFRTKDAAKACARGTAKQEWRDKGVLTEVIVKTKAGAIGSGSTSRSSYGKDPRASRG